MPGALVVLRSTASFCVAGQGSLARLASFRVVSLAIASLARLLSHPFLVALALISSSLVAVVQFNNRQMGGLAGRQAGRQTDRQTGRQAGRQAGRQHPIAICARERQRKTLSL